MAGTDTSLSEIKCNLQGWWMPTSMSRGSTLLYDSDSQNTSPNLPLTSTVCDGESCKTTSPLHVDWRRRHASVGILHRFTVPGNRRAAALSLREEEEEEEEAEALHHLLHALSEVVGLRSGKNEACSTLHRLRVHDGEQKPFNFALYHVALIWSHSL
ncbi:hypothetical protein OPV22_004027 [Ensete ventricosum]|uniref:Uncharacterized protein n=1 Tax=Ensete ventricosum TaxID=4639 RepID=A0AAV8S2J4_ENSVE|nr:hypothetical protein OPV22_004027 [Ensete ventricosum]RZR85626.1 hypothetical protein BHM03_00012644 [Ensete ventricosum]